MFIFQWIRQKAREAVLAGVGDAIADIDSGQVDEVSDAIDALRLRTTIQLPAPVETEGNSRRAKVAR